MKSLVSVLATLAVASTTAHAADGLRVLYLSKSSGFQHSVVALQDGKPSHSDQVLTQLAQQWGASITCTKDASLINAENLKNYDLVVFYTTGNLTEPGSQDQGAVMGPEGMDELLDWIKQGGGFMGFHAATDTAHETEPGKPTPYIQMIGAEFASHGPSFEGTVDVVDPGHPTMVNFPDRWTIFDEWYLFKNINKEKMHVLALLDPGDRGKEDDRYAIPPYPMVWCMAYGQGRVFFNGMGHYEDVWSDATFQQTVVDAAEWVTGTGPTNADPNYDATVPKE